jgi:hypothetical protein
VDTVTVLVSQRVGPANAEGLCPVCEQLCQKTAIEHERAHAIVLHVRATQPLTLRHLLLFASACATAQRLLTDAFTRAS